MPSILGRELFRSKVTSYRLSSFEDAVIFVYDVERALAYPASEEDGAPAEDSLAETLLHRLGLLEDKVPEPAPRKTESTASDPLK